MFYQLSAFIAQYHIFLAYGHGYFGMPNWFQLQLHLEIG